MASDSEPQSTTNTNRINLRIKSASHKFAEDVEFNVSKLSTVKQIKEMIRDTYPFHPEIKEQRLIYSGHILQDEQIFNDFLIPNTTSSSAAATEDKPLESYVIHLSCTPSFTRREREATTAATTEGLRQRNVDGSTTTNNVNVTHNPFLLTNSSPGGGPGANGGIGPEIPVGGGIPQEMAALHQMYVQQMLTFMTQWNSGAGGGAFLPPGGFQPTIPQYQQQHIHMQPPPQMPVNFGAAQQQQGQQFVADPGVFDPQAAAAVRQAAAAARVRDEDEAQQADMLDWIYTLSRVALIFSVVYFYSSFTRLLLVIGFTGLVIMLQRRQRRNAAAQVTAQRPPAPAADNPQPVPPPPAAANGATNPPQPVSPEGSQTPQSNPNTTTTSSTSTNDQAGVVGNQEPTPSNSTSEPTQPTPTPTVTTAQVVAAAAEQERIQRATLWTFVSSFVTSLIPDMAQH